VPTLSAVDENVPMAPTTGREEGLRPRRLAGVGELRSLAPDDPYVQLQTDAATVRSAWAGPAGALAWLVDSRRTPGRGHVITIGPADAAVALLVALLGRLDDRVGSASVPQGAARLLPARYSLDPANDWEWFATATPPPVQAGEERVHWLPEVATDPGGDTAREVVDLLRAHSGRHDAEPGQEHARRWCGVRDGTGRLVAVAAHTELRAGVPFLASVATLPEVRGQGLGSAVTGWITRQLLDEGNTWVTLGTYSDNDVARRIYQRLGFIRWHAFTSGRLVRR
jgi:GNAT superfamily N-acetyltransferase